MTEKPAFLEKYKTERFRHELRLCQLSGQLSREPEMLARKNLAERRAAEAAAAAADEAASRERKIRKAENEAVRPPSAPRLLFDPDRTAAAAHEVGAARKRQQQERAAGATAGAASRSPACNELQLAVAAANKVAAGSAVPVAADNTGAGGAGFDGPRGGEEDAVDEKTPGGAAYKRDSAPPVRFAVGSAEEAEASIDAERAERAGAASGGSARERPREASPGRGRSRSSLLARSRSPSMLTRALVRYEASQKGASLDAVATGVASGSPDGEAASTWALADPSRSHAPSATPDPALRAWWSASVGRLGSLASLLSLNSANDTSGNAGSAAGSPAGRFLPAAWLQSGEGESRGDWLAAAAEAAKAARLRELESTVWSTKLRNVRQTAELRSVSEAREQLTRLIALSEELAAASPPPALPLGCDRSASSGHFGCAPLAQHGWILERPARLRALESSIALEPKLRLISGLVSGSQALSDAELRREDGLWSAEFHAALVARGFGARAAAPDLELPTDLSVARADKLALALHVAGYSVAQAAIVLRGLLRRDTEALRRVFTLFDEDEALQLRRDPLVRTLRLLLPALPAAQASRLARRLDAAARAEEAVEFNEFASLVRIVELNTAAGALAVMGARREAQLVIRASLEELLRRVPHRYHGRCRALHSSLLASGLLPAEAAALLRAIFGPSGDALAAREEVERAWHVLDPLGRGRLSRRDFDWAFALVAESVSPSDVDAEFRRADSNCSGFIEKAEFGPLLERLAHHARGSAVRALRSGSPRSLLQAASDEVELSATFDAALLSAIPWSRRALAARLHWNLSIHGFDTRQVELVLRAIFCLLEGAVLDPAAAPSMRRAWCLLGGVDWRRARVLEATESLVEPSALGLAQPSGAELAARAASHGLPPELLEGCRAPRVAQPFGCHSTVDAEAFEKLLSLFGDFQHDEEFVGLSSELRALLGGGQRVAYANFVSTMARLAPESGTERMDDALLALVGAHKAPGTGAAAVNGNTRGLVFQPGWSRAVQTAAVDALRRVREGGAMAKGAVEVDVLATLDVDSKQIVPLAHVGLVRPHLSNLLSAGFDAAKANVIMRALYSCNDPLNGAKRRGQAWALLLDHRAHLRLAAERRAADAGEFRDVRAGFALKGNPSLQRGKEQPGRASFAVTDAEWGETQAGALVESRFYHARSSRSNPHRATRRGADAAGGEGGGAEPGLAPRHAAPPPIPHEVVRVFKLHDTDQTGALSVSELHVALHDMRVELQVASSLKQEVAAFLLQFDTDRNGSLSLTEYAVLCERLGFGTNGEKPKGLLEDEWQYLACALGEHLRQDQLFAIFAATHVTEDATVPPSEFARILKFMNPLLHFPDVSRLGSIFDHEERARMAREAEAADLENVPQGLWAKADYAVRYAVQSAHELVAARQRGREMRARKEQRRMTAFSNMFDDAEAEPGGPGGASAAHTGRRDMDMLRETATHFG